MVTLNMLIIYKIGSNWLYPKLPHIPYITSLIQQVIKTSEQIRTLSACDVLQMQSSVKTREFTQHEANSAQVFSSNQVLSEHPLCTC